MPLCQDLVPPFAFLIRKFCVNLSIKYDYSSSHILSTWIQGEEFRITKKIVSEFFRVPLVHNPTYPYNTSPLVDDVMSLLYGILVTWCKEPIIHSHKLTKFHYMLFRIAVHNIFPFSYVHTIPIDRCVFVYALSTDGSICFPTLFIQTIIEAHTSKSKKHALYFLVLPLILYSTLHPQEPLLFGSEMHR